MLKENLIYVYVFFHTIFCGCSIDKRREDFEIRPKDYKVEQVGKMAKEEVMENSGFAITEDGNLWTHADGGNLPVLYKINTAGKLLATVEIPNTTNIDWEDLAKDDQGNIYIGDFGNNGNKRQNLRIFRVKENNVNQVDTILFHYADQNDFPPKKSDRNFDCEAFFFHKGNLYLFSKDRGKTETVKVYKVPAQPGKYEAKVIDEIQISTQITAADISPDGKRMALLGYGNVYLFDIEGEKFFDGKKYCIPVGKSGQAEAMVFLNNTDFIFSNEAGKIFKALKKENK
ncbi:hypothetical protein [Adhaeribacter aquaticus]|uniref:hypothetical protein n=1 Tax=Adhaeribacter aquaticus TaxID=299567 RepID=UPI00042A7225|nr:hypothetical protein [Adhaeribacter aquaticus]